VNNSCSYVPHTCIFDASPSSNVTQRGCGGVLAPQAKTMISVWIYRSFHKVIGQEKSTAIICGNRQSVVLSLQIFSSAVRSAHYETISSASLYISATMAAERKPHLPRRLRHA
jgi:hypothetical protein